MPSGLKSPLSHTGYTLKRYNGSYVDETNINTLSTYDTSGGYPALGSFVGSGGLAIGPGFYAIGSPDKQSSSYYDSLYGSTASGVGMVDLVYTDTNNSNNVGPFKTHFPPVGDVSASMAYGTSVAIGSGVLAIGAPGAGNGAVYLYKYGASTDLGATSGHFKKLTNPTLGRFGQSLAIGGGMIFVGDPYFNTSQGKVYVYNMRGEFLYSLVSPYIGNSNYVVTNAKFGASLAYHDEKLAVGAPGTQRTVSGSTITEGRVHLFDAFGNLIQNYWPKYSNARHTLGGFGDTNSIAMTQNVIIIGDNSMKIDLNSDLATVGGFYVYPTVPPSGGDFIPWSGNSKYDDPSTYLGHTYVYNTDFTNSNSFGPYFGQTVAADGNIVVVSAPRHCLTGGTQRDGGFNVYSLSYSSINQSTLVNKISTVIPTRPSGEAATTTYPWRTGTSLAIKGESILVSSPGWRHIDGSTVDKWRGKVTRYILSAKGKDLLNISHDF